MTYGVRTRPDQLRYDLIFLITFFIFIHGVDAFKQGRAPIMLECIQIWQI